MENAHIPRTNKRPAIFIDRDGTIVEYVDLLHKVEDLILYPFSYEAITKINSANYLGIVITNQPVVAMNLCDIITIEKIHDKMKAMLKNHDCYIDDIFFCPHYPDEFFKANPLYNKQCECRKPSIGMIKKAQAIYNIDIEQSWIIGDTTRDIQTGINAGIRTILVRTGKAGNDKKYNVIPDFIFDNIKEAIDFLL